ncbi:MAG: NAD-dependent epimerase/dehydratase family protein [Planctomycetota bacterium]|jgi:nucleoside-diphosphate-sugar epimerase
MKQSYLVTGGAGFFGGILKRKLLAAGHDVVSIDLQPDEDQHPSLVAVQGDIRDTPVMNGLYDKHGFDGVFHCAALLAHEVKDKKELWSSNVDGTRCVAEANKKHGVRPLVFTSSNCVYATNFDEPVSEDVPPAPVEIYGRSKLEGEKVLAEYTDDIDAVCLRTPTIIDEGRLGLLAILFEFIDEGRKVWVVGDGSNRYQFLYAGDLVSACLRGLEHKGSGVYHVGSNNVTSLADCYQHVIEEAGTGARVAKLPKGLTIFGMKLAHWLRISPLGPYHYRMIASNFVFDTSKAKRELEWDATLSNQEILTRAYRYFHEKRQEIEARTDVSAHKQAASMGVIRVKGGSRSLRSLPPPFVVAALLLTPRKGASPPRWRCALRSPPGAGRSHPGGAAPRLAG